jgi:hypothetical protein
MDDVQLANWHAGIDAGPVEVYRIFEPILTRALGIESGAVVWLSDYTLNKTRFKHKEINFQDYQQMQRILSNGFVSPGNKQHSIEVIHADLSETPYKFWRVCLKGTARDEVFVTMFHRSHLKDARRLYRRAHRKEIVLRDHSEAPIRHLLGRIGAHV